MLGSKTTAKKPALVRKSSEAARARPAAPLSVAEASFLEAFNNILVDEPVLVSFDGSLSRKHMRSVWTWLTRDIDTGLAAALEAAVVDDGAPNTALDGRLPTILGHVKQRDAEAAGSNEAERKLTAQMGGDDVRARMPVIINAFRCRSLLHKAEAFGRASNSMADEAALGTALLSMPLKDQGAAALLFHTMMGQSSNPNKIFSALIAVAGGASEAVIKGARLGQIVDATLAHAQDQIGRVSMQQGPFSDADLICKAVTRFHRLVRAITGYIELERGSRWSLALAEITKTIAQRIEPRLREVSGDVAQSLRKPRDGVDRVDSDRLLAALNGIYLLAAVREAKDSLALHATFDKIWHETGQSLEVLLNRNLELFKQNPADENVAKRLDMGLKMAEVRFSQEYADILRRARDVASKRRA